MTTFPDQDRPAFWQRLFFAIPVLGWIARDIAKDASNGVYAAVAFLATFQRFAAFTTGSSRVFFPRSLA